MMWNLSISNVVLLLASLDMLLSRLEDSSSLSTQLSCRVKLNSTHFRHSCFLFFNLCCDTSLLFHHPLSSILKAFSATPIVTLSHHFSRKESARVLSERERIIFRVSFFPSRSVMDFIASKFLLFIVYQRFVGSSEMMEISFSFWCEQDTRWAEWDFP